MGGKAATCARTSPSGWEAPATGWMYVLSKLDGTNGRMRYQLKGMVHLNEPVDPGISDAWFMQVIWYVRNSKRD